MELTIVYDNEVFRKELGLKSDWGFSCLIKNKDENILFDCGAKGEILIYNMNKLDIDPKIIDKIVISHEHWDHNGGLKLLYPHLDDTKIYRIKKIKNDKKTKVELITDSMKISEKVYTTGRLTGKPVDEQSLVVKGKEGWYVIAGCSHPGVSTILKAAKKIGNIRGIIGGFHGFNNFSSLEDLDFICPCHCTKYKKKIREIYPKVSSDCGVGKTIDLDEI